MTLLRLPQETFSHILSYLYPVDIVHVGQTCRAARDFVVPSNGILWQTAFLQLFDDPQYAWDLLPKSVRPKHIQEIEDRWNWHDELKRRCLSLKSVNSDTRFEGAELRLPAEDILQTLLEIIETAKSKPTEADLAQGMVPQVDDRSSLNIRFINSIHKPWGQLEDLIHDSHCSKAEDDDDAPRHPASRPVTRSMTHAKRIGSRTDTQSRLHVFYGRTARESRDSATHGYARSVVYNWSNPTPENDYGPFKVDGSGDINWPVLEAVMSVITNIFEMCSEGRIAIPPGFWYSLPYRTLPDPTLPEDWAGVTGSWIGTYSYIDYAALYHYNTWADPSTRPSLDDVAEASGDLMKLNLKLDPSLRSEPKLQTVVPICEDIPPLYFRGDSKSYDPFGHPRVHIAFKGFACLCRGGREVRWKYIISYRGHDQWQLEGVQPGGIRSGPIYGVWTQWGHEEHAPVGAFMYIQEELCKKQDLVLSSSRRDVLSQLDT